MHCYHVHDGGFGLPYMGTMHALVSNVLLCTATMFMMEAVAHPTWVQCMHFSKKKLGVWENWELMKIGVLRKGGGGGCRKISE